MKKAVIVFMALAIAIAAVAAGMWWVSVSGIGVPLSDIPNDNERVDTVVFAQQQIAVPAICQYPTLPTGCESVAATMVLQFYGEDIDAAVFAQDWLECREGFYSVGGKLYGPDPNKVFVGTPFVTNAYGCFAGPIVNAINRNSTTCTATALEGRSLEQLCDEYIDNGKPLLIWATMHMRPCKEGNKWYLEDGTQFTWPAGEHCLVLVGYSEDHLLLNDPITGSTVAYLKTTVAERFAELGNQAVYIDKKK